MSQLVCPKGNEKPVMSFLKKENWLDFPSEFDLQDPWQQI